MSALTPELPDETPTGEVHWNELLAAGLTTVGKGRTAGRSLLAFPKRPLYGFNHSPLDYDAQ